MRAQVEKAVARFDHDDYRIFVGLYPNDRATIDALMQVRESYFDRFIGTVDQRWGSLDGYLGQAIGVDDALRDQLQARFVA